VQARRAVDALAIEKPREDGTPPRREGRVGNERVLGADLALVLGEPRVVGGEDGEVDVDEKLLVAALRQRGVSRRHDERADALGHVGADAGGAGRLAQPLGAARLVVRALHVVDGVVEPEADLDLGGVRRQRADALEQVDALAQVLDRVVATLRLPVRG